MIALSELQLKVEKFGCVESLFRIDVCPEAWQKMEWDDWKKLAEDPEKLVESVKEGSLCLQNGYHRFRFAQEQTFADIPVNMKVPFDMETGRKLDVEELEMAKKRSNKAGTFQDSKLL